MERVSGVASLFRFGLFEANCAEGTLTRSGTRIKIQDQPFSFLVILLERPGEIVTREELRQGLWPEGTHVDFDGSLNVILKRLRAALGDDPDNPRFIQTVPRRGYRFIAPVSITKTEVPTEPPAFGSTPPELVGPTSGAIVGSSTSFIERRRPLIYAAILLTSVLAVGLLIAGRYGRSNNSQQSATHNPPVILRKSVAVLGFKNLSGHDEDSWLAPALSEMLSTELSGGEKLRLISGEDISNLRTSAPWPTADSLDPATSARVGSALNSDVLVLGSYMVIGTSESRQLRLDIRMQDGRTGEILAERAEMGSAQDLFRIVSRIGAQLRTNLGVGQLEGSDEAGVMASLPLDPDAARFYAMGVTKLRQFDALAAKDLLQQAAKADPKFPLVHAMLARAWAHLGFEQNHQEEAKKAFDLSTDLPRAQRLLVEGEYYESLGRQEQAASVYHALFELFPDNVEYGLRLAGAQRMAGHGNEALTTIARLRKLPSSAADDPNIDLAEATVVPIKADSLRLIHAALAKASAQGKKMVYAHAKHAECITLVYGEHPLDADASCRESYEAFLSAGNRLAAADTLRLIGDRQEAQGHTEEALGSYNRAVAMLRELGDHEKTGAVLNNLGSTLMSHGKFDAAEPLFKEAKIHFEQAGDRANAVAPVTNMADLLYLRGQLPAAARAYEQAIQMIQAIDISDASYELARLADLELTEGKVREAHQHIEKSIESLHGEVALPMSNALIVSGELAQAEGNLSAARETLNRSLKIGQNLGDLTLVAQIQTEIATLELAEGHREEAERDIRQAIAQFEKANSEPDILSAYVLLSRAMLAEDKWDEARKAAEHAAELSHNTLNPALRFSAMIQSARVQAGAPDQHEINTARSELLSTIGSARRLGYFNLECEARLVLGKLELKANSTLGRKQLKALASETRNHGFELIARDAEEAASSGAVVAENRSNR
jgi:eukaryotic-like serine/threonine-protein kinase